MDKRKLEHKVINGKKYVRIEGTLDWEVVK